MSKRVSTLTQQAVGQWSTGGPVASHPKVPLSPTDSGGGWPWQRQAHPECKLYILDASSPSPGLNSELCSDHGPCAP